MKALTVNQIKESLLEMSIEQLNEINADLIKIVKAKTAAKTRVLKKFLRVGDQVRVNSPEVKGLIFTVEKINQKRADLTCATSKQYNLISAPINLLTQV